MRYLYLALLIISTSFLTQCSEPSKERKSKSPRKEVLSSIISPKNNSKIILGDSIVFDIKNEKSDTSIDSISLFYNGMLQMTSSNTSFKFSSHRQHVGLNTFVLSTFLDNGNTEKKIVNTLLLSGSEPELLDYEVLETYPHDVTSYTQGLLIDEEGNMYENTGRRNKSFLKKIDLKTGKSISETKLDPQFFGEGISIINDKIFMLTWESRTGFVYNKNTLERISEFRYPTEGWGLTNINEDTLIMSDGSHKLYLKNPKDFSNFSTIEVYDHQGPITNLNELEYIEGKVFANRYMTNLIYIIDLKTGKAEQVLDLSEIHDWSSYHGQMDYLNGIAYDNDTKSLYVTGKLWPLLFKIELK